MLERDLAHVNQFHRARAPGSSPGFQIFRHVDHGFFDGLQGVTNILEDNRGGPTCSSLFSRRIVQSAPTSVTNHDRRPQRHQAGQFLLHAQRCIRTDPRALRSRLCSGFILTAQGLVFTPKVMNGGSSIGSVARCRVFGVTEGVRNIDPFDTGELNNVASFALPSRPRLTAGATATRAVWHRIFALHQHQLLTSETVPA